MSHGTKQLGLATILAKFVCAAGIHSNENHWLKTQLDTTVPEGYDERQEGHDKRFALNEFWIQRQLTGINTTRLRFLHLKSVGKDLKQDIFYNSTCDRL